MSRAFGGPSWNSMTYEKPEQPPPRMPTRSAVSGRPRFAICMPMASTAAWVISMRSLPDEGVVTCGSWEVVVVLMTVIYKSDGSDAALRGLLRAIVGDRALDRVLGEDGA